MHPDTKLVLDAWRKLVVENYRLRLQVAFLRGEIKFDMAQYSWRVDDGGHGGSRNPDGRHPPA